MRQLTYTQTEAWLSMKPGHTYAFWVGKYNYECIFTGSALYWKHHDVTSLVTSCAYYWGDKERRGKI
jgi:hypothetical protein